MSETDRLSNRYRPIRRRGRAISLVLVAAGAVATLALPQLAAADIGGFRFGVTAGEVGPRSAVLWAATRQPGPLEAEVATDREFEDVVATEIGASEAADDNTIQVAIRGLRPNRRHFYRFCESPSLCSRKGKLVTAPKPGKDEPIRFAYTGDTDGTPAPGETTPFFGTFDVFEQMAARGNHFNVHMGDTIYSDSNVSGAVDAVTVEEKWAKYRQNLTQENLRVLRRSTGFYSHWDDHEFVNDFSIPEDGQALYDAGVQAFTDYAPVAYSPETGTYRSFRWGRNLEVFILDERSFRSAKASDGGVCDNPQTGQPDLAPTTPEEKREFYSFLIPSLAAPVSQACKDAINDPSRTMLGQAQLDRFVADVSSSDARWKVVLNETPIQQFYALPYDRWEGYAYERVELLNRLMAEGVRNLVFLTTDTHAAFANVTRLRTFDDDVAPANAPAAAQDTPYRDFIAGPVATNTFWAEIDQVTGSPGNGALLSQIVFKPEPPTGLGMLCAQGDAYSFGQVKVTSTRLKVDYRDARGKPVEDIDDERCGPYTLRAKP